MGGEGALADVDADGGIRDRRAARLRGDDDARPLPVAEVVLYSAAGCHLCDRARAVLEPLRAELAFELDEVDISGDPELEERYRELLPVVEIGGRRAFVYFVDSDAFRRKLAQSRAVDAGS